MIAVIPARGGSKRIPRKNIKPFFGIPMISHTIEAIRLTGLFSRIIVSTEDFEIAQIAKSAGAEALIRDVNLADDYTTTIDVIADAVLKLSQSANVENEIICCIYPLSPMLSAQHISEAYELLITENLDYVFTAKQFQSSPARSFRIGENGKTEMCFPENVHIRTQDLPNYFHDAALFYIGRASTWSAKKSILDGNSKFVTVGKYEALDVDEIEDWEFLELLYRFRKKNS